MEHNTHQHKWAHKGTSKIAQTYSCAQSANYIQIDSYFCEICLQEKEVEKTWNGIPESEKDVPLWVRMGGFTKHCVR
jgi:aromatic ring-opening dioxygenase catalytic subunit (LigB family)